MSQTPKTLEELETAFMSALSEWAKLKHGATPTISVVVVCAPHKTSIFSFNPDSKAIAEALRFASEDVHNPNAKRAFGLLHGPEDNLEDEEEDTDAGMVQ